ncbi:MAG TPA: Smr/MutS family protein [Gammaproteobacteria bacterium]|nr:Smr/MutS family protein [Gammaproteobacteria bacterium]
MTSTAAPVPGPHTVGIGDVINFRRPGIQQRTLSRLKRGQIAIGRELDLHGETNMAAQERIMLFLEMCIHDGIRCIRIIHGKGHGSRNKKPVIKNLLNNVLRENRHVLAFTSAPASDGGTGALYVLLRKSPVNPVSGKPV